MTWFPTVTSRCADCGIGTITAGTAMTASVGRGYGEPRRMAEWIPVFSSSPDADHSESSWK